MVIVPESISLIQHKNGCKFVEFGLLYLRKIFKKGGAEHLFRKKHLSLVLKLYTYTDF